MGHGTSIFSHLNLYFEGLILTMELVSLSLFLGLALAVPLALASVSRWRVPRLAAALYIYIFRGTPLLVQVFLVYYGLGQFALIRESVTWILLEKPFWCALIAFSLNTAAYTAEILRGAIAETPAGEIDAAWAFGMSPALVYRRIVLPSVLMRALPAYSNEVIFMLHGSSLAGIITLVDITGAARIASANTYNPSAAYSIAAILYLMLALAALSGFRAIEKRWCAARSCKG